jgi:hypothetical protein
MIKGDIDLTENLDFYHDPSERNKNVPIALLPWKTQLQSKINSVEGRFSVDSSNYYYIDYDDSCRIVFENLLQSRRNSNTSTSTTISTYNFTSSYTNNTSFTVSYNFDISTNRYSVDDWNITSYYDDINMNTISSVNIRSSYLPDHKKDTKKDCFGHNKKSEIPIIEYHCKLCGKRIITGKFCNNCITEKSNGIPWRRKNKRVNMKPIYFGWGNDYPWDEKIEETESIHRDNRIPWLRKLKSWIKHDYLDELREGEKDYKQYLTSSWFHPDGNNI